MSAQQPTPQFTDDDIIGTDSEITDEEQTEKEGTKVQTASHQQTRVGPLYNKLENASIEAL